MPWMALRTSRVRSWPRPQRWRQMSAIPAAPAIIGILMHAPRRCLLGKIGSSPMKVIEPPVFSGESPSSCITARNCALMSKSLEPLDVLLVMMFPFNVVGLFGCVSSMGVVLNSPSAGDYSCQQRLLVDVAIVKAGLRSSFRWVVISGKGFDLAPMSGGYAGWATAVYLPVGFVFEFAVGQ